MQLRGGADIAMLSLSDNDVLSKVREAIRNAYRFADLHLRGVLANTPNLMVWSDRDCMTLLGGDRNQPGVAYFRRLQGHGGVEEQWKHLILREASLCALSTKVAVGLRDSR